MRTFIWFEVKKRVRQAKTWGLIILLLIVSLLVIKNYNLQDKFVYVNYGKDFKSLSKNPYIDDELKNLRNKENYKVAKYSYGVIYKTGEEAEIALQKKDMKEFYRAVTFGHLLYAKSNAEHEGTLREISFRNMTKDIWKNVSNGVDYDSVSFKVMNINFSRNFYFDFLTCAKYFYSLYEHNLKDSNTYQMDSMAFCYHYLNKIVPILLAVLILIIMFDSINEEHSKGSLKLILTQPFSRKRYLLAKIIVGVMHTIFVVVIPMIGIVCVMGIGDFFKNYNYPVLYLRRSFTRFFSIHNNLEYDLKHFGVNKYYGFSLTSYSPKGSQDGISNRITILPLYQFLLLSSLILLFMIIFYVVLNTLISCIFKSKIISFAIAGLITIVGMILSNPLISSDSYNLSPFSMNNPVRILSGTYNVTALTAMIVLFASSLVLFIVNVLYFRKKNL
ncbi:ABC transporter permease subunit [Anaeromicropila herbilytica]|uniref:ABC transporter permease n=1 Tax=Anaeromicropila herbilytica TaxID=2785025 RepID=A0A7R7EHJ2_9FIRM|nr:ABC transporter permease subunit [Anaeromicropila herbilytica]BCN28872.1 hypothetical protein bsdtb5_01670 [Anaeromicropila herbilytica]